MTSIRRLIFTYWATADCLTRPAARLKLIALYLVLGVHQKHLIPHRTPREKLIEHVHATYPGGAHFAAIGLLANLDSRSVLSRKSGRPIT